MKKLCIVILALAMTLTLAACSGGSSGSSGNETSNAPDDGITTNPPVMTPEATPSGSDDPCPCCPNCIQEDCACKDCADSNDCKCSTPRGFAPSLTYNVEVKVEFTDIDPECPYPADCGAVSIASTEVTMNWIDNNTGYFGISSNNVGEYLSFSSHYFDSEGRQMLGSVAHGTTFDFSAMLSIPGTSNANVIRVGLDFSGEGDVTMNWPNGENLPYPGMMERIHGMFLGTVRFANIEFDVSGLIDPETYEFDHDLGMFILEIPLTNGVMQDTFSFDSPGFTITITLTPVS